MDNLKDIQVINGNISLLYANGIMIDGGTYTEHNLNYYRHLMEKSEQENLNQSFKNNFKEAIKAIAFIGFSAILELASLYLLYNIDIKLVYKIIIGIIATLFLANNVLINKEYLELVDNEGYSLLGIKFYLENINYFRYYKDGEEKYIIGIEEVVRYKLEQQDLESIIEEILLLKEEDYKNIITRYIPKDEIKKSKSML